MLVDEAVTAYKEGETVEVTEVVEVPAAEEPVSGEQPAAEEAAAEQPTPAVRDYLLVTVVLSITL